MKAHFITRYQSSRFGTEKRQHPDNMILIGLILALAVPCVSAGCSEGWTPFNGFCYSFSNETLNWLAAESACQKLGARLVEIDNKTIQDWIAGQLNANNIGSIWAGGSCIYNNATWEWVQSKTTLTQTGYTNWAPGEPNHNCYTNLNQCNDKCLQVEAKKKYKWNNTMCVYGQRYVCEMRDVCQCS